MTLTEEQQKKAIQLLQFLVDGCSFAMDRRWESDDCAKDNTRGFSCASCMARAFLLSIGEKVRKG